MSIKIDELQSLHRVVEFEVKSAVRNNQLVPWDKVKELYDNVGAYVSENVSASQFVVEGFSASKINKYLTRTNLLSLSEAKIYMPRGCKGTLKAYGLALLEEAKLVADFEEDIFKPFYKWTNKCLSDPKRLGELTDAGIASYDNKAAVTRLERFVKLDSQMTMGEYGTLIDRQRDWNELESINSEIEKTLSDVSPGRILKLVNSIKASTDLIIEQVEDSKSGVDVSKATADLISDRIYECALACAYLGRISALATGYTEALRLNEDRIDQITK